MKDDVETFSMCVQLYLKRIQLHCTIYFKKNMPESLNQLTIKQWVFADAPLHKYFLQFFFSVITCMWLLKALTSKYFFLLYLQRRSVAFTVCFSGHFRSHWLHPIHQLSLHLKRFYSLTVVRFCCSATTCVAPTLREPLTTQCGFTESVSTHKCYLINYKTYSLNLCTDNNRIVHECIFNQILTDLSLIKLSSWFCMWLTWHHS